MRSEFIVQRVIFVLVLVTLITNFTCLYIRKNIVEQEKLKAEYTVSSTVDRIKTELEKYIEKSDYLKNTIESGIELDETRFESITSRLYSEDSAIKAIELAPDGIVQNIYPIKNNEAAFGINMLTDHVRKWAANSAKNSKQYTIDGPYDLKQGGKGALLFDPIYKDDLFWGFTILVVDWEEFLRDIHLNSLKQANYDYVIWKRDRSTKDKIVIAHSTDNLSADALRVKCELPNNKWNFEISPKNGWVSNVEMISLSGASLLIDILVTGAYAQAEIRHKKDLEYANQIEKQAKKAQEASAAKTRFLFSMSHDIRTPMNAIIGYTKLLESNIGNVQKEKNYLSKIRYSSNFLLDLINQVLEMARIESGKATLILEVCRVQNFIDSLNSVFQHSAEEKGLKYEGKSDIKHEYVYCDRIKLEEIFLNVVGNAFKYTEQGSVYVYIQEIDSLQENLAHFICTVKDTGAGMSEEYLPHVFEDFSRERSGAQTTVKGTGLGLPIVKSLMDLMGGTIDIESKVGLGTKITLDFALKIASEKEYVSNKEEKSIIDESILKGKHILLAEDNTLNAEIALTLLQEHGLIVDHVLDGVSCISQLKKEKADYYSLILMDIQMPNMDGYEATKKIREFSNIPIIAMTANAFDEDKQKALKVGMDGHIAKPIDVDVVLSTIFNICKQKGILCPVCRKYVFENGPGSYEICPVCGWEDDKQQYLDPTLKGGANHLSLVAYRDAYNKNHE